MERSAPGNRSRHFGHGDASGSTSIPGIIKGGDWALQRAGNGAMLIAASPNFAGLVGGRLPERDFWPAFRPPARDPSLSSPTIRPRCNGPAFCVGRL